MCEDYGLCTYEKHHKLKILLFLSSMRSYSDELKAKKFNVNYYSIKDNFKVSYEKKLEIFIIKKKIKEVSLFEIEDKFFEKKILSFFKKKKIKINIIQSPMLMSRMNLKII